MSKKKFFILAVLFFIFVASAPRIILFFKLSIEKIEVFSKGERVSVYNVYLSTRGDTIFELEDHPFVDVLNRQGELIILEQEVNVSSWGGIFQKKYLVKSDTVSSQITTINPQIGYLQHYQIGVSEVIE